MMGEYGQRGLPIQSRAFCGDFPERIVHQPVNHFACPVDAVFDESGADQGFNDVAQNGTFISSAGFGFAVAEQNESSDMEFVARNGRQRFLGHRLGAHLRQLPFRHVGMRLEQGLCGDQFQHCIAEELEPLIVGGAGMLMGERAVCQRLDEELGADGGAECVEQFLGRRLVCRFLSGNADMMPLPGHLVGMACVRCAGWVVLVVVLML